MKGEQIADLIKRGGIIKVSMSRDGIFLIAGGETNAISAKQADAVLAAMQDGKIPTVANSGKAA